MSKRKQSPEIRKLLGEHSCCELCGDQRNLEVHHIIPVCCGGTDNIDNLIVICGVCHAKLTPKRELQKVGINRARAVDVIHIMARRYYELAGELMFTDDNKLTGVDWPDVFDALIDEMLKREIRLGHEV